MNSRFTSNLCAFASILAFIPFIPTHATAASQVTTERIVTLPDYSASSGSAPATLERDGSGSAVSGTSINGVRTNSDPVPNAEGAIFVDEQSQAAPVDGPTIDHRPPLPILRDVAQLPPAVRRMHDHLYRAALSGDIEQLRMAFEMNEMPPILGFDTASGDPIAQIKAMSGDEEGSEILAILAEILEAGFVLSQKGTPQEMYVWPYFADYPLHRLSPQQRVELFRLVTANEYAEMDSLGHYFFYRVGIAPDGTWHYFLAGE